MDGLSAIFHNLRLRARRVFAGGQRRPWVVDQHAEPAIWCCVCRTPLNTI